MKKIVSKTINKNSILTFKSELYDTINTACNRFLTITQKVSEMKITLRRGFKPP